MVGEGIEKKVDDFAAEVAAQVAAARLLLHGNVRPPNPKHHQPLEKFPMTIAAPAPSVFAQAVR